MKNRHDELLSLFWVKRYSWPQHTSLFCNFKDNNMGAVQLLLQCLQVLSRLHSGCYSVYFVFQKFPVTQSPGLHQGLWGPWGSRRWRPTCLSGLCIQSRPGAKALTVYNCWGPRLYPFTLSQLRAIWQDRMWLCSVKYFTFSLSFSFSLVTLSNVLLLRGLMCVTHTHYPCCA